MNSTSWRARLIIERGASWKMYSPTRVDIWRQNQSDGLLRRIQILICNSIFCSLKLIKSEWGLMHKVGPKLKLVTLPVIRIRLFARIHSRGTDSPELLDKRTLYFVCRLCVCAHAVARKKRERLAMNNRYTWCSMEREQPWIIGSPEVECCDCIAGVRSRSIRSTNCVRAQRQTKTMSTNKLAYTMAMLYYGHTNKQTNTQRSNICSIRLNRINWIGATWPLVEKVRITGLIESRANGTIVWPANIRALLLALQLLLESLWLTRLCQLCSVFIPSF